MYDKVYYIRALTDRIREETNPNGEGCERLSLVLLKMGQSDKAEKVYEILLKQTTNESQKEAIYHQLGIVKYYQGEYQQAATFYEKSIEIKRKIIPPDHHGLAGSTLWLGNAYYNMGEHQKALSFHEEALKIYQKLLPPNHSDLASSYNNIGLVYENMGNYSKACSLYERAVDIGQQSLSANHPEIQLCRNNFERLKRNCNKYFVFFCRKEK
jgi:tetratricopeptide (TPR) repeat protein